MMEDIVAYLNDLNGQYATGEADYNWSSFHDNCVHTLRNALAAASVWRPKAVWEVKLRQIFHLAIPANEFVDLAARGNSFPIDQYWRVRLDDEAWQALGRYDWLPTRDGALLKILPIHTPNELFDSRYRLFVLESPLRRSKSRQLARMLAQDRYVDLGANLRFFEAWYEEILARSAEPRQGDLLEGRAPWLAYVKAQLAEVRRKLARLHAVDQDRPLPPTLGAFP
jgi:hypothetical protein